MERLRPLTVFRNRRFWVRFGIAVVVLAVYLIVLDLLPIPDGGWWRGLLVLAGFLVATSVAEAAVGPVLPEPSRKWPGGGAGEIELSAVGRRRLDVTKQLREHADLTYDEATLLLTDLPARFRLGATTEDAEAGLAALREAGATAVLVPPPN